MAHDPNLNELLLPRVSRDLAEGLPSPLPEEDEVRLAEPELVRHLTRLDGEEDLHKVVVRLSVGDGGGNDLEVPRHFDQRLSESLPTLGEEQRLERVEVRFRRLERRRDAPQASASTLR